MPLIILVWPFPVTAWLLAGPRRRVRTTIRVFEALLLSYPTVLIFVNLYWLVYGERERGWVWMVPGEGMVVIGAAFLCYGCACIWELVSDLRGSPHTI